MTVILSWLGRQALWGGVICLLGALGYGITAISMRRQRDIAQFSLERDSYQQRMVRAWMMTLLFLLLGGVLLIVRAFVLPSLPVTTVSTPTVGVGLFTATPAPLGGAGRATVVNSAAPLTATAVITPVIVAVAPATLTPTPAAKPTPGPPAAYQPDCPSPEAQLTLPTAGGNLAGEVRVEGTANTNAFSYYKFEVQFPGSDTPNFISQYNTPVLNGFLGMWDVSDPNRYPAGGPYLFQLVVVDIYGNTTTCTVPVNIVAP